jgi:membrane-associated phospholipid phosphatase
MRDDSADTSTPGGPPAPLGVRGERGARGLGERPAAQDLAARALRGAALGGLGWPLVAFLGAALAGYAVLASAVVDRDRPVGVDLDVAVWVADSMPSWAEWLARPVTWLGGFVGVTLVVVAATLWLLRRGEWPQAVLLVAVALGIQLLVSTAKNGYARPRPDVGSAIDLPSSFSFPSGHAATGIAVFGLLGLVVATRLRTRARRVGAISAGFALGIASGASRVVLDVHYLSDVLAGWCLGLAWLSACLLALRVFRRSPA